MSATVISPRRERLQRSELAVPATPERFFEKACRSSADVVFLDLEDAVALRLKDDNACRANGLRAIDGPFTDFRDEQGFFASARRAAALGFEGKWAIHPTQIDPANRVFSPSAELTGWATRVLAALDAAAAQGDGAVNDDGVLVDLAHARQAQLIQRRAALVAAHLGAT